MPPAGFEPTIPAIERPQIHALDRAASGIGTHYITPTKCTILINSNINRTYPTCFIRYMCTIFQWQFVFKTGILFFLKMAYVYRNMLEMLL